MKKTKFAILLKCILTGVIYAVTTCVIQVPVANMLFSILKIQSDSSISDKMLPILLLSIFIVGIAMALFYYRNGHLFSANSKWKQGIKFAIFVYLSNYIPQVFFLDANKGLSALINSGFPAIQVELFDFLILMITVLLMITYMPCHDEMISEKENVIGWKCILCGGVFSAVLIIVQEFLLPLFGIPSMVSGLNVSTENIAFFYGVMIAGFIVAGILVSKYTLIAKHKNRNQRENFCLEYGILIWSAFDLTMIPLGFGITSTITFITISMVSFISVEALCKYFTKAKQ